MKKESLWDDDEFETKKNEQKATLEDVEIVPKDNPNSTSHGYIITEDEPDDVVTEDKEEKVEEISENTENETEGDQVKQEEPVSDIETKTPNQMKNHRLGGFGKRYYSLHVQLFV